MLMLLVYWVETNYHKRKRDAREEVGPELNAKSTLSSLVIRLEGKCNYMNAVNIAFENVATLR
jgi:hypothetical protein